MPSKCRSTWQNSPYAEVVATPLPLPALALGGPRRFLNDRCVEIDPKAVESSIRQIAVNRKGALFVGADAEG